MERIKAPKAGQVDHFDKGHPGLTLRISYGGKRTWVFMFRHGGNFHRMTLGTYPVMSLAAARAAWRDARAEVEGGRDPRSKRETPAQDVGSVLEDWLSRDQAKNRSVAAVRRSVMKDALPFWQHRSVNEITKRDVLDVIDAVVDRGSKVQARRLQAHLHRFFKWCAGRGIIDANPIADLPKPGAEKPRDRVLNDVELRKVWTAAKDLLGWPFGTAVQLLMLTGARLDEIGELKWSEIGATEIRLTGARTKNGQPHTIPLSSTARSVIDQMPGITGCPFVLSTNGKTPVSGWSKIRDRLRASAAVDHWTLHDIRRSVATGLQRQGVALQVTEAVLNHTGSRGGVVGISSVTNSMMRNVPCLRRGALT